MTENVTQRFYDRISSCYDAIADGGEHKARQRGVELLAVQPGEQVLEIGYGTGHSLVDLAKAAGDSGRMSGVDISPGMQSVAQRRVDDAGLSSRVELKVANTPPLPYEADQFDVVSMSFTLELFPLETIPAVLAEVQRVLRPTGRVGVVSMATTKEGEDDSLLERTYKWMHAHFPHFVDCQPIPVEDFFVNAGFSLALAERLSIFTMPVAAVVGKPTE